MKNTIQGQLRLFISLSILILASKNTQAQVNYSEIASRFNKMLNQTVADREAAKMEIENYTNESISSIYNKVDEQRNLDTKDFLFQKFVEVSNNCVEEIKMQYRLLQNGSTPLKNYRSTIESLKRISIQFASLSNNINSKLKYQTKDESSIRDFVSKSRVSFTFDNYSYYELNLQVDGTNYSIYNYQTKLNSLSY